MADFALSNVYGPVGSLQRARLYAPDSSTVADLALTESPAGTFGGTVTLDPDATDPSLTYDYEVRQVLTQDAAGYDASTTDTVSRGTYGYLSGAFGFWWTQAALESRWGTINTAVASALDGQGTVDVPTIQAVGDGVDADADRLVRAYGYGRPVPADSDDYAVASRIAVDVLHYRLEGRRGPDLTPTVRDKLAAAEAAAWAELEDLLQGPTSYNGAAIDFPRTGTAPVTAPIGLRPTTDLDGRTVLSPALSRGPVWDAVARVWQYY